MQLVSSLTTPRSVTRCSSALSNKNAHTIRSFSGMVGRTAHQRLLCGHAAVPSLRKAIPRVAGRQRVVTTKAMFERFTEKAIKVVMLAQEEARRLGHNFVRIASHFLARESFLTSAFDRSFRRSVPSRSFLV